VVVQHGQHIGMAFNDFAQMRRVARAQRRHHDQGALGRAFLRR
jgi:hypothetical protein